ncbi:Crp/Fnr family transcriptional regulator [Methylobacterium sp. 17Sr1-1]|uniref:Crp/Fnr family transcriptional regulator n=1 Tax=Methylobacterium sp. 17Sr1-1 TaxID=2202826 RepID=UPI000D702D42|nr:Crp/Fnr family transcriptional regulator [Methylobacterium sp. 17Sr1-1]AWN52154.1 cyclic nucleotide-binding protein [Methylobacterium sp. 17Sr1-1]
MNPLTRKLERFACLSDDDKSILQHAASSRLRNVEPRCDIIAEGETPRHVNLILSGWACRYKQFEDGRRQIVSFLLPGDLCDLNVFLLRDMDHSIGALSPVTLAQISPEQLRQMLDGNLRLTQALWWETLVTAANYRERIVTVGRRTALERVAHLVCELFHRLSVVGLVGDRGYEMPITQTEMADALGISSVHVNRTLKELRTAELMTWKGGRITILNLPALEDVGLFNPNYLHLDQGGR